MSSKSFYNIEVVISNSKRHMAFSMRVLSTAASATATTRSKTAPNPCQTAAICLAQAILRNTVVVLTGSMSTNSLPQ